MMALTSQQIHDLALSLSPVERSIVLESLLASFADSPESEALGIPELRRRWAELKHRLVQAVIPIDDPEVSPPG